MGRLNGKVALVTGGAGEVGVATARKFVAEGARVVLADLEQDALSRAAAEFGDAASTCVCDVTQPKDNERMVAATEEAFGGLDIFIANAGIEGKVAPITEQRVEDFDAVIAVNVRGPWLGLKYAMPALERRGGGSAIILSSIAGVSGSPGIAPYNTSKHAVIGLMRAAAQEGAPMNIRVNTVNPAPLESRMMRSLEEGLMPGEGQVAHDQLAEGIPLGRYGQAQDVAGMLCFLASDEASYLTGAVYMVDGGMTAG